MERSNEYSNAEQEVAEDVYGYKTHMDAFSKKIAFGVFLVLFGVALFVALGGVAQFLGENIFLSVLALALLLISIAVAVFFFIYAGMDHDEFLKKHGQIKNVFTQEEKDAFSKKFILSIAVLVPCIILDVVALIAAWAVVEGLHLSANLDDLYGAIAVAGFLFILGLIIGGICFMGVQKSKYDMEQDQEDKDEETPQNKLAEAINSMIMLLAVGVFLYLGFAHTLWHPAWVVFPVGGILCGIVSVIFNLMKK